jgi:hypothetical protein
VEREPVTTGPLDSIAISCAPQYSVSYPSVTCPVEVSVVTNLQILQSFRASHEVAAQAKNTKEAANKTFLFILNVFQFKDNKTIPTNSLILKKLYF